MSSEDRSLILFGACGLASSINPRPAGLFSHTRSAGGEGADSAPCLTSEPLFVETRKTEEMALKSSHQG